ncbi:hypothetical protein SNE40_018131 [Patella caerulea]|uniref:Uncharacterized protein n=1 Tax=Patella caerulea TaxID=87958 RepID=A0AAN8PJF2_PATCE
MMRYFYPNLLQKAHYSRINTARSLDDRCGTCPRFKRLKGASVPSVFSWNKPVEVSTVNRQHRAVTRVNRKSITDSPMLLLSNNDNILVEDIGAEVELVSEDVPDPVECDIILETKRCDTSVQTDSYSQFSVERLKHYNKKNAKLQRM